MPMHPNYYRCTQCVGRPVRIRTRDGRIHHGIVSRVNRSHVYLRPVGRRNLGGFGYGYYGPRRPYRPYGYRGYGYGYGAGWAIALGAIVGLALAAW